MAILKDLVVYGSSRFLNKAYFNDLQISGAATFASLSLSGNLSVSGTSTLTGNTTVGGTLGVTGAATFNNTVYLTRTQDLSGTSDEKPALVIGTLSSYHIEVDPDEIHAKKNASEVSSLFLNYNGGNVYLSNGTQIVASNGNFSVARKTTTNQLDVTDIFWAHDFEFEIQHIVDGIMRIAPTLRFPARFNGETSTTTAMSCSKNTQTNKLTITITDGSIVTSQMAGIVWNKDSKVKVSGKIGGVATETMTGTISSINNGSMSVEVSGGNFANISATSTLSDFDDITVMVYERKDGSNYFPTGILMNCYDSANQSATIRVYGGTSANPNVMIGNLRGMPFNNKVIGETIGTQNTWGILTSMGYFEGAIVSNEGKIGGWTIGDHYLSAGEIGQDNNAFIRNAPFAEDNMIAIGGEITYTWRLGIGTHFGVTGGGELYADLGAIGGVNIGSGCIYSGSKRTYDSNNQGFYLGSNGRFGLGVNNGSKLTWDGTTLTVTGSITANTGYIGGTSGWTIASQQLSSGTALGADDSMYLATKNLVSNNDVGGHVGSDWRFTVGSKFGITRYGDVYATSVTLGPTSGYYAKMNSTSFDVKNGQTQLASFGATSIIGDMNTRGISLDSNGFKFNNGGTQNFFIGVNSRQTQALRSGSGTVTNSSTYVTVNNIKYYRVSGTLQSSYNVISVLGTLTAAADLNGDEMMFEQAENPVDFVVQSSSGTYYLYVNDRFEKYSTFEESITYNYTVSSTTTTAPYMVFGRSAYSSQLIAGEMSFAQGDSCVATGLNSFAIGNRCVASAPTSFSGGMQSESSGNISFSFGTGCVANTVNSVAIGCNAVSSGSYSVAIGYGVKSNKQGAVALGVNTTASGQWSTAMGKDTIASAMWSTAMGSGTKASSYFATAMGSETHAAGHASIATGTGTLASGNYSFAGGDNSKAAGIYSFAMGVSANAIGDCSTAIGNFAYAIGDTQFVIGKNNKTDSNSAFIIGNGTGSTRSNALTVDWSGNITASGKVIATNTSHIGMIIMSTTLDTMAKVIAIYGGTTWIQHSGYMLRGATTGVTANSATSNGGAETVTLTVDQMPSHTHIQNSHSHTMTNKYTGSQLASGSAVPRFRSDGATSVTNYTTCGGTTATNQNTGGGQAHNNMPPYKNVYIWERTA